MPDPGRSVVPVPDRVTTAEAMILGFVCEHSLPFTLVPNIIAVSKSLAKDTKALSLLSMDRTAASYKTKYGLGKSIEEETLDQLRKCFFSLNIDESTSNSLKKMLAILVSYFSGDRVVVKHLATISVIHANSQSLCEEIVKIFKEKDLPWDHLMSMLLDSCNVMRGSKSGFEKRIRDSKAPHLLDIDGDTCHHAHNSAKKLCEPFQNWVEVLFTDIHNDLKWSADLKDLFQEVCEYVGVQYNMPERFISHRWLSAFDVAVDTLRLLDALTVFYYGFLPRNDRLTYTALLVEVYQRKATSQQARDRIREIHTILQKKQMTTDGKNRKGRLIDRILYQRKKSRLCLEVYVAVLPLLKKYVLLFETKAPMIHKLHDEICDLVREFLSCFMKPQALVSVSLRTLQQLDVTSDSKILATRDMFMGKAKPLTSGSDIVVKAFLQTIKSAYTSCGAYLCPLSILFGKAMTPV
jgi:hypothetical protein